MTRTNWKTKLIHPERHAPTGFRSLTTPVYRGSTTLFESVEAIRDTWNHDETPYTYGQYGTPTTLELAARIAELEGGHRCFITPGGQTALTLVYFAYLAAGEHVLVPDSVYGPSRAFAESVLRRYGVEVEFYPALEGAAIRSRIRDNTRLVWCESPGSHSMDIQDVPAIAEAAHARSAVVALDNTWSAGVLFDAFAHGVDISVQALTKYVGGHSDLLLGAVTVRQDTEYQRIGAMHQALGLAASPDDCSLALRGLDTLHVRLAAIERSALQIAHWFAARDDVEAVLHPALPTCPGHALWSRDFSGASGVFAVVFRSPRRTGGINVALNRLSLFKLGYSWGGVASLAVTPDPAEVPHVRRYDGRLVRFSIGLEDTEDLIRDLERAFDPST